MINGSNMNGMTEYGVDSAYKTLPTGSEWSDGVVPEKTLPAAWWNAILGLFSKNLNQSKLNLDNIVAELNNVLSINSTTPNPAATDQLKTFINNFLRNADNLSAGTVPQARLSAAILLTLLKTVDGSGSGLDADTVDGSHYNANDILAKLLTVDGPGSSLDADLLDGLHSSSFATAAQGTKADNALPFANYTAADVLAKIKTVDGSGSGLDADLLDGLTSYDFSRRFVFSGVENSVDLDNLSESGFYHATDYAVNTTTFINTPVSVGVGGFGLYLVRVGGNYCYQVYKPYGFVSDMYIRSKWYNGSSVVWSVWSKMWNGGNDGSGSGLDADLLDGLDSARFAVAWRDVIITGDVLATMTKSGMYVSTGTGATNAPSTFTHCYFTNHYDANTAASIAINVVTGETFINKKTGGTWSTWRKIWNEDNDGPGSGLDADTVDGLQPTGENNHYLAATKYGVTDLNNIAGNGIFFNSSETATNRPAVSGHVSGIQFYIADNSNYKIQMAIGILSNNWFVRFQVNGVWQSWQKLWNEGNDGSGSGLDADLLDGLHASSIKQAVTGIQVLTADPSSPSDGTIWLRSDV